MKEPALFFLMCINSVTVFGAGYDYKADPTTPNQVFTLTFFALVMILFTIWVYENVKEL